MKKGEPRPIFEPDYIVEGIGIPYYVWIIILIFLIGIGVIL